MVKTKTYLELNDGDMELRGTLHEIYAQHNDVNSAVADKILTSVLNEGSDLLFFKFQLMEETSSLYTGGMSP
jgi:hypothetical protein